MSGISYIEDGREWATVAEMILFKRRYGSALSILNMLLSLDGHEPLEDVATDAEADRVLMAMERIARMPLDELKRRERLDEFREVLGPYYFAVLEDLGYGDLGKVLLVCTGKGELRKPS